METEAGKKPALDATADNSAAFAAACFGSQYFDDRICTHGRIMWTLGLITGACLIIILQTLLRGKHA